MIYSNVSMWNNLSYDDKKTVVAILIGLLLLVILVCLLMFLYISKLKGKAECLGKKHKTTIQKALNIKRQEK
jgi:hypothetical protein